MLSETFLGQRMRVGFLDTVAAENGFRGVCLLYQALCRYAKHLSRRSIRRNMSTCVLVLRAESNYFSWLVSARGVIALGAQEVAGLLLVGGWRNNWPNEAQGLRSILPFKDLYNLIIISESCFPGGCSPARCHDGDLVRS